MDPNETLKQLRALVLAIHIGKDAHMVDLTEEAENMATLFDALDTWLTAGGFSPTAWLFTKGSGNRGAIPTGDTI